MILRRDCETVCTAYSRLVGVAGWRVSETTLSETSSSIAALPHRQRLATPIDIRCHRSATIIRENQSKAVKSSQEQSAVPTNLPALFALVLSILRKRCVLVFQVSNTGSEEWLKRHGAVAGLFDTDIEMSG